MFGELFSDPMNIGFVLSLGAMAFAMRYLEAPKAEPAPVEPISLERVQRVLDGLNRAQQPPQAEAIIRADSAEGAAVVALTPDPPNADANQAGVVARLVPQIPIRVNEEARSWFGGAPEMPVSVTWPDFQGKRGTFLAQICCADLPPALWDGRGPRQGWLAFFADPETGRDIRVVHFNRRGPVRATPEPGPGCLWRGVTTDGLGLSRAEGFPRWPLDIVAVAPGGPDPRAAGANLIRHEMDARGFDLADPQHHPFDWPSLLALLDSAHSGLVRRKAVLKSTLPDLDKQLRDARKHLSLGGMKQDMTEAMQKKADVFGPTVEAWKESIASLDAADEKLQAIIAETLPRAERETFKPETAARIMERLRAIELVHVERATEMNSGLGEPARTKRLPLTVHDRQVNLFVFDYELLREDMAKQVYCDDPYDLPTRQRDYFEGLWLELARFEMPSMGHKPFGFVFGYDSARDYTLAEFPNSDVMNWRFGDGQSLAATLRKGELDTIFSTPGRATKRSAA